MEPPGTAPGSEPIITGAFIAIVGVAPDKNEYRGRKRGVQGRVSTVDKPEIVSIIKWLAVNVKDMLGIYRHSRRGGGQRLRFFGFQL